MKLIAKHLPLLALALLVCSTELRAEEFPFKVGDMVRISTANESFGATWPLKITNIKGKWIEVDGGMIGDGCVYDNKNLFWFNCDLISRVAKCPSQ